MPDATPPRPLTAPDVVAGLLADVAERDERLAEVTAELEELREAKAPERLAKANAKLKADVAGLTVARDALGHDLTQARSAFAKLAGQFTQGAQSGWTARVSGTVLRRLCVMAMCEPPSGSGLEALAEASTLVAERDGLRDLVADILQSLPDTADEQEWRDRAGAAGVTDPDGTPYRAWTEDDL